jgi:hypothetical protein
LALGKTLFFGRGGENIEEFISIGPHRPGDPLPAHRGFDGCLRGDKISRVQGTMKASEAEIEIVNTGKHPMVVNGVAMTRATLRAGDVVAIAGEVVFVCEFRLPEFPALRHATIAHLFGEADAAGIAGESPAAWAMRDEAVGIGRGKDFVIVLGESGERGSFDREGRQSTVLREHGTKATLLEALGPHRVAVTVPVDDAHAVATFGEEDEPVAAVSVVSERLAHEYHQGG